MQRTTWHVLKWADPSHLIEMGPFPRSKIAALRMAEEISADGSKVVVERHVFARTIHKTFNKQQKD